jgi:hypothetical protein
MMSWWADQEDEDNNHFPKRNNDKNGNGNNHFDKGQRNKPGNPQKRNPRGKKLGSNKAQFEKVLV